MNYAEEQIKNARERFDKLTIESDIVDDDLVEAAVDLASIKFMKLVADMLPSGDVRIKIKRMAEGDLDDDYKAETYIYPFEGMTVESIDHLRMMVETIEDMYYVEPPKTEDDYYEINVKVSGEYLKKAAECEKPHGDLNVGDVVRWEALMHELAYPIQQAINRGKKEVVIG